MSNEYIWSSFGHIIIEQLMKKHPKAGKFHGKKSKPNNQSPYPRGKHIKRSGKHTPNNPQSRSNNRPSKKNTASVLQPRGPKLTHAQLKKQQRSQKNEESLMAKLIIEEELKKDSPNFEKVREYLGKIKSRGSKQRLRDRALKLQKQLKATVASS